MKRESRFKAVAATLTLLAGVFFGGLAPARADISALTNEIDNGHWVPYVATEAAPNRQKQASRDSIVADLNVLKKRGFTAISTYGCDNNMLENIIPEECDRLGLKMIIGVWDPYKTSEIDAAVRAANKHKCVLAVSVGNEGGCVNQSEVNPNSDKRYTFARAVEVENEIRSRTGKPVTSVEQFEKYTNKTLMDGGDFLMPNIHPFWNKAWEPHRGVEFTMEKYMWLRNLSSKPIICKEVGYPTSSTPDYPKGRTEATPMNEDVQATYFKELATKPIHFMYFEAFDCNWKDWNATEKHWGIYNNNRTPKKTVSILPF
jgi:exo-beta-1,3-glucanase (GH17 family)